MLTRTINRSLPMIPDDFYKKKYPFLDALLRSAVMLAALGVVLAVLNGLGAILAQGWVGSACFGLGSLAAFYGLWLNWRLHLDALLFAELKNGTLTLEDLDASLGWFLNKPSQPRSMDDRIHGVKRLYRRLIICLPLSAFCFALGLLARWVLN